MRKPSVKLKPRAVPALLLALVLLLALATPALAEALDIALPFGDGDPGPAITAVEPLSPVTRPAGLTQSALGLPDSVGVTLSDGSTAQAPVSQWACDEGYDPNVFRDYLFQGELDAAGAGFSNPDGLKASITVTIEKAADKNILAFALREAQRAVENGQTARLLPDALEEFEAALDNGQRVYETEFAQYSDIQSAYAALQTALWKLSYLQPDLDTSRLEEALEKAAALNAGDYEEESFEALQEAVEAGKAVLEDPGATQEEIDAAAEAIERAIEALVPKAEVKPDTSRLEEALEKAAALNAEDYDEESFAALQKAVEAGKAVLEDPDATQEEIDAAAQAIEDAIEGLTAKEPNPPAPPVIPGTPGKSAYPVSLSAPANGSISADASSAPAGQKITVTTQPDEGFITGGVTVEDGSGSAVAVEKNDDGSWSFIMPDSGVTVSARFVTPGAVYSDLNDGAWYRNAIAFALNRGIMKGTGASTFDPDASTTRGMIATVLYRLAKEPEAGRPGFTDVADGQYYAKAIGWAAENGVVSGYGDGTFGPNDAITREQLAAMLWRWAGKPAASGSLSAFSDADSVSGYARAAMVWAVENGIINGADGKLMPGGDATRAQVAAVFERYLKLVEEG